MMLLSNLAEPEWIQISCTEKLLVDVICVSKPGHLNATSSNYEISENNLICPINAISKGTLCYLFLWYSINNPTDLRSSCKLHYALPMQGLDIKYFHFLFVAIQSVFPPILSLDKTLKTKVLRFTYDKYLSVYHFRQSTLSNTDSEGFILCTLKKTPVVIGDNLFQCRSNVFISYLLVCDGSSDCPNEDNSDEEFCHCQFNKKSRDLKTNLCKEFIHDMNNTTICSTLYFSVKGFCHKYIVVRYPNYKLTKPKTVCNNNRSIDIALENDMVIDCPNSAEDEEILTSLLKYEKVRICRESYEIPCKQGHSKCYNISHICGYKVNHFGRMEPCSNGAHSENCEHFECNMMFKCVKSYCIPWSYVCDGKWDCSTGEDERYAKICVQKPMCSNMFKCRGERHKCLHLGNICNDIIDCPQADDEYLCELKQYNCPAKCICLALAIDCLNVDNYSFNPPYYPYISIIISHSKSVALEKIISTFRKAKYLTLKYNGITHVCYIFTTDSIVLIDLGYNYVHIVKRHCFMGLYLIKSIILPSNHIISVESHAFCDLFDLKMLDLSNNILTQLSGNVMKGTSVLKLLILKNISTKYLDKNLFHGINSIIIYTNDYKLCCVAASDSVCTATIPGYISCKNLLPNSMMRWLFIIVSILIIVINGIAIAIHLMGRVNTAYFAYVIAISISGIHCGVYLGIIWMSDAAFKGEYMVNDVNWRSSPICFLANSILLYFTVTIQLLLTLLALSRLMIVINPLHTTLKNCRHAFGYVISIYIFAFLLTVVTLLSMILQDQILPTNLCLPFFDPTNSILTIKVSVWSVVICSQCLTSIVITVSHLILIKRFNENIDKLRRNTMTKSSNILLLTQLFAVTFFNVFCWLTANIIYVITMIIPTYSIDLIIWMIVFVVPLNSLINPVVFILSYLRKVQRYMHFSI